MRNVILVTGGSGFVGRHLVEALAGSGAVGPVRVFDVQPSADRLPDGAFFVTGAIEDRAAVDAAADGVDAVVHLAAKVQPDARAVDEMTRINVEGTRTIFEAAAAAGCRLFVHMSSAGVYGRPRSPAPFRETDETRPESPYQRTKLRAEEVLRTTPHGSMTLNILRPAGMYGSGSHLEIPAYRKLVGQRWSVEQTGGVVVHPTHVSDIVGAILALLERPAADGSIFNIGGERQILLQELQAMTAEVLGAARRRVVIPSTLAAPLAGVMQPLLAMAGRPQPQLRAFSSGRVVSAAVDDGEFRRRYPGVPVLPLQDGIREQVEWARRLGLVQQP